MNKAKKKKLTELIKFIEETRKNDNPDSYLIAVLHKAQELFSYLPCDIMDEIAYEMNIPTAHIWGVATFYHYFNLKPPGKHVISICLGTACYVKGADRILETLKDNLGIDVGGVTEDGLFSLQGARCLGACGLAPVVMIDGKIYGDLTPEKMVKILDDFRKAETKSQQCKTQTPNA